MKYKNAQDILPDSLLKELQQYVAGENIYIPNLNEKKKWGESSGARMYYCQRNAKICELYKAGKTIDLLADEYHLSVDSIRKILHEL